jgi:hypothetical protein
LPILALSRGDARAPWLKSNKIGKLEDEWLPAAGPDRELHRRLVNLRNTTYAHTDPEGGRKSVAHLMDEGVTGLGEEWVPLRPDDLERIADLCQRQADRFSQAIANDVRRT